MKLLSSIQLRLFSKKLDRFVSGVSNSFSAAGHIYIPGFYTGQTPLKKKLSRQDCVPVVAKRFCLPALKTRDQILRHTSHANLFLMMASGITWESPLLRASISGNCVM